MAKFNVFLMFITIFCVSSAVMAELSSTQRNYQLVLGLKEIPTEQPVEQTAVRVYAAAKIALDRDVNALEVEKILRLLTELTAPISPVEADVKNGLSEGADKKLKQRLNGNYQDRYLLVERMIEIMNKYAHTKSQRKSQIVKSYLPNLYLIAKHDSSTHIRLLAAIGVASVETSQRRAKDLLKHVAEKDGAEVIEVFSDLIGDRKMVVAHVQKGRNKKGEPIFKTESKSETLLANGVTFALSEKVRAFATKLLKSGLGNLQAALALAKLDDVLPQGFANAELLKEPIKDYLVEEFTEEDLIASEGEDPDKKLAN